MNSTPLVSVIIPNYNHARYLDRRLQTVLNQTYPDFEVWILDDHSTDNSLEVIAKYKDNPHVAGIVVNKENSGSPFKQWDKGISLATGDIIWIAESDDYCELNLLEELVKALLEKPDVVVAYSSYIVFTDDGYISEAKKKQQVLSWLGLYQEQNGADQCHYECERCYLLEIDIQRDTLCLQIIPECRRPYLLDRTFMPGRCGCR